MARSNSVIATDTADSVTCSRAAASRIVPASATVTK